MDGAFVFVFFFFAFLDHTPFFVLLVILFLPERMLTMSFCFICFLFL
jgi:hypothetical protein